MQKYMSRGKTFWKEITPHELENVRENTIGTDQERWDYVEDYTAEDIREIASRKPSNYAKSRECDECGFDFRIKGDMVTTCKVCGASVH